MTDLKPCPFCGGEAFVRIDTYFVANQARYRVGCDVDSRCHGYFGYSKYYTTEAEAIAAWNARAERTGDWILEHSGTLYDKWRCSKCGYLYVSSRCDAGATDFDPNYCPNCGSRVIE